jgi:hypothetical protein
MLQYMMQKIERGELQMAIQYGKGGPARRRRKDDPDEDNLPPSYDLDKLDVYRRLRLPGGLKHALQGADVNRAHPLKGVIWCLHTWQIRPGMWLLVDGEESLEWYLVFTAELSRMILVNRRGTYSQLKRADASRFVLDVGTQPPWWEEYLEELLEDAD